MIDALSALQLYPAPPPRRTPVPATLVRRFDVIDANFDLVMTGASSSDLGEPTAESALEPAIVAELRLVLPTHDFAKRPVATALVGTDLALRISRSVGPAGTYYHVLTERTTLRRLMFRVETLFRLDENESELLRLIVAGYELPHIAKRIGQPATAMADVVRKLERKLNCVGRQALTSIVYASPFPLKSAV